MKRILPPLFLLFVALLLAGCASLERAGLSNADERAFGELPASFRGELPCADCAGIRYRLSLFPDHAYALERVYLGAGESRRVTEQGQWSLDGAATLTLTGGSEGPQQWRVRDSQTLERLDRQGQELDSGLVSELDYRLTRTASFSSEPLEDRYWKLVELEGEPLAATAENQREPHLVLHGERSRVAGATGCNRLMGDYQLDGERLSFGRTATTMMACLDDMHTEQRFLAALEATTEWRVLGRHLEFYDAQGDVVARFEVVHLT